MDAVNAFFSVLQPWFKMIGEASGALTALFTLALCFVTWRLWKSTKTMADATRMMSEATDKQAKATIADATLKFHGTLFEVLDHLSSIGDVIRYIQRYMLEKDDFPLATALAINYEVSEKRKIMEENHSKIAAKLAAFGFENDSFDRLQLIHLHTLKYLMLIQLDQYPQSEKPKEAITTNMLLYLDQQAEKDIEEVRRVILKRLKSLPKIDILETEAPR